VQKAALGSRASTEVKRGLVTCQRLLISLTKLRHLAPWRPTANLHTSNGRHPAHPARRAVAVMAGTSPAQSSQPRLTLLQNQSRLLEDCPPAASSFSSATQSRHARRNCAAARSAGGCLRSWSGPSTTLGEIAEAAPTCPRVAASMPPAADPAEGAARAPPPPVGEALLSGDGGFSAAASAAAAAPAAPKALFANATAGGADDATLAMSSALSSAGSVCSRAFAAAAHGRRPPAAARQSASSCIVACRSATCSTAKMGACVSNLHGGQDVIQGNMACAECQTTGIATICWRCAQASNPHSLGSQSAPGRQDACLQRGHLQWT